MTANWNNLTPPTNPDKFFTRDTVTFDNSAGVPHAITISGVVAPASFTVNSDGAANSFSFAGTGKISGNGTLTKSGTSTLTISTYQRLHRWYHDQRGHGHWPGYQLRARVNFGAGQRASHDRLGRRAATWQWHGRRRVDCWTDDHQQWLDDCESTGFVHDKRSDHRHGHPGHPRRRDGVAENGRRYECFDVLRVTRPFPAVQHCN